MSEPDSPLPRTPVVAVVGTCEESTASFLSLLVRGDADVDRQMPAPGEVLRWTLDTKYYVADVACVFHPLPGAYVDARGGEVATARDRSLALEMAANAEALVLCYDPLDERAFEAVASFAGDVAEAAGDEERPEVKVLVGLYRDAEGVKDSDPGLEKAWEPAQIWAASRGYEALAAGAKRDADAAVAAASAAEETGGDDGVSRVRQALEAHVWPGLTMKSKAKEASLDVANDAIRVVDKSLDVVSRDESIREREDSSFVAEKPEDETLVANENRSGADGDGSIDDLESMLAEMARVRAAAAGASDEERRKAAAEAATRMMRMFDLDGDAETESETESEEREDAR